MDQVLQERVREQAEVWGVEEVEAGWVVIVLVQVLEVTVFVQVVEQNQLIN